MSTATTHIKTDKQLVPALRFKEFNGEIKETLFGNHYSFHTTNSLSRDKLNYDNGEVRNIHYGDIHTKFQTHFHLTNEDVPFINEDVDLSKIKEDSYCKIGDLVIADASEDYADIGKSIELIDINNEKLLAGLHTFLARPSSDETAVGFISCLLKSWKLRKQIMTIAQGTKVLSLSTGRVSKLKLNLPSLPEQQKIASFLSAVDEKIQQLTRKKNLLEQYKKGVMQQLFSGQLRFKDENGNTYPDWEEKRFDEINNLIHGDGDWILSENIGNNEKYSIIQLGNIGLGEFIDKKLKTLSEENFKAVKGTLINKGDILINRMVDNDLNVCLFPYSGDYITSVDVCWIRSGKEIDNSFISFLIQTRENQKKLLSLSSGSGRVRISKKNLFERFKFQLPSLEEQLKIATYLSSIDTKIESVNNQIAQTQTFKKGLLQQMFVAA
jgi:type I restriction enzyme, S subunit